MIAKGMIQDIDDIQQVSRTNQTTGEHTQSGVIKVLTSKPTQVIDVRVNVDLWKESQNGKHFKSLVGKQFEFLVEYNQYSFTDASGAARSGTTMNLFNLPALPKAN